MELIKEKKSIRQHVYRSKKDDCYYMIEMEKNPKGEITKISEKESKDLKKWVLMGEPYTYLSIKDTPVKTLEEVYAYMYDNYLKDLDLFHIVDSNSKNGDSLYDKS